MNKQGRNRRWGRRGANPTHKKGFPCLCEGSGTGKCISKAIIFAPEEGGKFVRNSSKICKNRINIRKIGHFNSENSDYGKQSRILTFGDDVRTYI